MGKQFVGFFTYLKVGLFWLVCFGWFVSVDLFWLVCPAIQTKVCFFLPLIGFDALRERFPGTS